jgi:spore germination cell wall hydrolase CwlJ-like protein
MRKIALVGIFFFVLFSTNLHADTVEITSPIMDSEIHCMTRAIYFESKSEPVEGQLAVGTVIVNRTMSGEFPDTVCGVIKQRTHKTCQFQFMCDRKPVKINKKLWEESKEIAQRVLVFGENVDILRRKKALFFHATYVHPKFAQKKYRIVQIGGHLFYSGEKKGRDA